MHIHLEKNEQHAIQSYSEYAVVINQVTYQANLIVNRDTLISPWEGLSSLEPILSLHPEVIIIGHTNPAFQLPLSIRAQLSQLKIGIECMNLGAASRTFNVLLSENRAVVLGINFCHHAAR